MVGFLRRQYLVLLAGACLFFGLATAVSPAEGLNPVAAENLRPGTPGWLGKPASRPAIEVYASSSDAVAGDRLAVHVATDPAARYRVEIYRLGWYGGIGARRVACSPACAGAEAGSPEPSPAPDATGFVDAGWPVTDAFHVGSKWVSGYYLVKAVLMNGSQAGRSASTYVVVRSAVDDARMLVQVPVNTWQAYNGWGGKSLYPFSSSDGSQAIRVSFNRPYDWTLPGGQGPLGWELPLVRFIGTSELLGAIGLLLPSLTRVKPIFTAWAGAGLATVMVLATGFHVMRDEMQFIGVTLTLAVVAAFVAWGRFVGRPIEPR